MPEVTQLISLIIICFFMRLCHLLKRKRVSIRFLESHKNPAPKLIDSRRTHAADTVCPAWILKNQSHWEGISFPKDDAATFVSSQS